MTRTIQLLYITNSK